MKDQITALMEALRLSHESENLRRKKQDVYDTVGHIEGILGDPIVRAAIHNLQPLTGSPALVPGQPATREKLDA